LRFLSEDIREPTTDSVKARGYYDFFALASRRYCGFLLSPTDGHPAAPRLQLRGWLDNSPLLMDSAPKSPHNPAPMPTLYLIDGSGFIFRAPMSMPFSAIAICLTK
jgi:hypothetical protein